jgi:hypothetical protein
VADKLYKHRVLVISGQEMLMHGEEGFNHYRRLARAFGTPYEYDIFKGEGVPLVPYHPEILPIANAAGTGVMCWVLGRGKGPACIQLGPPSTGRIR